MNILPCRNHPGHPDLRDHPDLLDRLGLVRQDLAHPPHLCPIRVAPPPPAQSANLPAMVPEEPKNIHCFPPRPPARKTNGCPEKYCPVSGDDLDPASAKPHSELDRK